MNWKEFFVWDNYAGAFYALGQALSFMIWMGVGLIVFFQQTGMPFYWSLKVSYFLGSIGVYWYSWKKYQKVRPQNGI